jgi:hypothetical protein
MTKFCDENLLKEILQGIRVDDLLSVFSTMKNEFLCKNILDQTIQ